MGYPRVELRSGEWQRRLTPESIAGVLGEPYPACAGFEARRKTLGKKFIY